MVSVQVPNTVDGGYTYRKVVNMPASVVSILPLASQRA
jgi:hypothetical protein